jgi:para-nitrobenzyl esterase
MNFKRAITLALFGLLATGLGQAPSLAADAPAVTIADGALTGATIDGADKFLGIPFAAPPVGDLRWKPPAKPVAWSTPRDATQHAMRCSAPAAGDGVRLINEDCLYLDVYRPAGTAADAKLPVIVYFHGGGDYSGSPDIYDGGRAATVGKAIVVMPAYRLGALGFMATADLGKEDANAEGAYGILDQIQALQWVQSNIASFGGNPDDVSLTGQSSGAADVCNIMAIGSTKGLYRQAVMQSGVCQTNPPLSAAEKRGSDVATKVGCTDLDCLRKLPADALVDAWGSDITNAPFGTPLLPKAPLEAFADGSFVQVPTLVGFARNEMWGFMHGMYPLDEANYEKDVNGQFGDAGKELLARYPAKSFPHNEYAFGAIQGDSFMVCPAFAVADRVSRYAPVSMYEFADATTPNWKSLGDDQATPPGYKVGPGHTSELFYLYDYKAIEIPLDATQVALGNKMIVMWTDFGRKPDATEWPAYKADNRQVVEIEAAADGGITTATTPFATHNCDFWNK